MKTGYVLGLLAVFVVFASLGSQCQKVTDPAGDTFTGYSNPEYAPPFNAADFADEPTCQAACNAYYNEMKMDEIEYHKEMMDGLQGSDPAVKQMRKDEIQRHNDEMKAIQTARNECVRSCHDQGGISGGF
jgi:hypothetical protein